MPRKVRIQYPGAIYHAMSRGDRCEKIFLDDVDRQDFLKTLAEACAKTGWQIHAYCLMPNHFHLVVETPNANLVEGMRWLLSAYTIRLNRRHKLFGHVFSGRYKALLVDGSGTGYLKSVCDYVHLNPVRAAMLKPDERLAAYPWTSMGWHLAAPEHRPAWVRSDRLLGEHGLGADTAANRAEFERRMELRRRAEEDEEDLRAIRRGWCYGSDQFRHELLQRLDGQLTEHHSGEEKREGAQAKSKRILGEELARNGWIESDLKSRRKSDPVKLAIAARLRKETTLTLKEVAELIGLGTAKSAKSKLARWNKEKNDRTTATLPAAAKIGI